MVLPSLHLFHIHIHLHIHLISHSSRQDSLNCIVSMHQQTIQRLQQKLDNFSPSDPDDNSTTAAYALKQKEVMDKLRLFKNKNDKNFAAFHDDLDKANDWLRTLERTGSKKNNLEAQLFENLERWIHQETTENVERTKAVRKGLLENIDKKYKTLKGDAIETIQAEFQEVCKQNLDSLETKLAQVTDRLEEERAEKEETASELVEQFGEEILKLETLISQEKQERKTENLALLDLLDQIQGRVDTLANEEIREREKVEGYIERKLEEVCYSIESKILGNN